MKQRSHAGIWILVLLIFTALFISTLFKSESEVTRHPVGYSQFVAMVEQRKIDRVEIQGDTAYGYSGTENSQPDGHIYEVTLPTSGGIEILVPELKKANLPFTFKEQQKVSGQWPSIMMQISLMVLFLFILIMIFRASSMNSRLMNATMERQCREKLGIAGQTQPLAYSDLLDKLNRREIRRVVINYHTAYVFPQDAYGRTDGHTPVYEVALPKGQTEMQLVIEELKQSGVEFSFSN